MRVKFLFLQLFFLCSLTYTTPAFSDIDWQGIALSLKSNIDYFADEAVISIANSIDVIGSKFNLCRPPLTKAVRAAGETMVDSAKKVGSALIQGDVETMSRVSSQGLDTIVQTSEQMFDEKLSYAPVT